MATHFITQKWKAASLGCLCQGASFSVYWWSILIQKEIKNQKFRWQNIYTCNCISWNLQISVAELCLIFVSGFWNKVLHTVLMLFHIYFTALYCPSSCCALFPESVEVLWSVFKCPAETVDLKEVFSFLFCTKTSQRAAKMAHKSKPAHKVYAEHSLNCCGAKIVWEDVFHVLRCSVLCCSVHFCMALRFWLLYGWCHNVAKSQ